MMTSTSNSRVKIGREVPERSSAASGLFAGELASLNGAAHTESGHRVHTGSGGAEHLLAHHPDKQLRVRRWP